MLICGSVRRRIIAIPAGDTQALQVAPPSGGNCCMCSTCNKLLIVFLSRAIQGCEYADLFFGQKVGMAHD